MIIKNTFILASVVAALIYSNHSVSAAAASSASDHTQKTDMLLEQFIKTMKSPKPDFAQMESFITQGAPITSPSTVFANEWPMVACKTSTALHLAVGAGIPSVIPFLLKHIDHKTTDNNEQTALFAIIWTSLSGFNSDTDEIYEDEKEIQEHIAMSDDPEIIRNLRAEKQKTIASSIGKGSRDQFIRDYKQIISDFHAHGAPINPLYYDKKDRANVSLLKLLEEYPGDTDQKVITRALITHINDLLGDHQAAKRTR